MEAQTNSIREIINHAAEKIQMMYYVDEDGTPTPHTIVVAPNSSSGPLPSGIPLPQCMNDTDYMAGKYVTFRFHEENTHVKAWLRVFHKGEAIYFTRQEKMGYSDAVKLPELAQGRTFHVNYPILSHIDTASRSIWIIGDLDTMPGPG